MEKVLHPHPVTDAWVNYLVLGVSAIIEGVAWTFAYREFSASKGHLGFIAAIRQSKNPAVFTVLMEDSAAMLGLVVAFAGIAVGQWLDMPILDGVASIFIGVILAVVAVILAVECKGLLIGESARSATVRGIRAIAESTDGVVGVNELLTMHLGPEDILVTLSLDFVDGISSEDIEALISTLEQVIKHSYPDVTRVFIEAQSLRRHRLALAD